MAKPFRRITRPRPRPLALYARPSLPYRRVIPFAQTLTQTNVSTYGSRLSTRSTMHVVIIIIIVQVENERVFRSLRFA